MNLGRGFADSERGKTELFKVLKPREEKFLIMTVNSIYLVSETWCTFMNPYKHLVHLKSTTGHNLCFPLCTVWVLHLDALVVWRDPGCESNPTASCALSHCDRVICSGKGPFLAQKRCLTLELLNQVSRKQEKVQEGDSMSVGSTQHNPVAPERDGHFLSDLSMLMLT